MPEGHTIHRLARQHRRALRGQTLTVASPQGRFTEGARRLNGAKLTDVEAYGKHLFYRWTAPDPARPGAAAVPLAEQLHVHLGLYGKFRLYRGMPPPPTPGCRLQLSGDTATAYLSGPTACELLDPSAVEAIKSRLGPDPLRVDADPAVVYAALQRRRAPIGQVLLDQKVIAGVGNVYRAEALFVCGIHPDRPCRALSREEFDSLWATTVAMLSDGVRRGRIVTVNAADLGQQRLRRGQRLWVYGRPAQPCRRCGAPIETWMLGGRRIFACPVDQPNATFA